MFDVDAFVKEGWPKHVPLRTGEHVKKPGDGELAVMFHGGDYKLIFDPDNRDEVDAARESFNRLKNKGFAAFKVKGKDGEKGDQIREFDPEAGRIIMTPPMRGGR